MIGISQNSKPVSGLTHIRKVDIRRIQSIPKDVSCIVHLAAMTDVKKCQEKPAICFETNVLGTKNMLELARKADSKFIFSSTSHVYGIPSKLPVSEKDPLHPTSIYSASKACGERLCETYSRIYGMDVVVLRNFSTYGPNNPSYAVIHRVIKQILKGNKIKIGNLFPKRDFIYISDVISAFELVIKKDLKRFSTFNVGTGKNTSIENICKKLIQISGKKISIIKRTMDLEYEVPNIFANISKINRLGWRPKVSLEDGLKTTFDWFADN